MVNLKSIPNPADARPWLVRTTWRQNRPSLARNPAKNWASWTELVRKTGSERTWSLLRRFFSLKSEEKTIILVESFPVLVTYELYKLHQVNIWRPILLYLTQHVDYMSLLGIFPLNILWFYFILFLFLKHFCYKSWTKITCIHSNFICIGL